MKFKFNWNENQLKRFAEEFRSNIQEEINSFLTQENIQQIIVDTNKQCIELSKNMKVDLDFSSILTSYAVRLYIEINNESNKS